MYLILPLALIIVFVAVAGFVWAARKGQFDDLDTPAMRALHEDPQTRPDEQRPDAGRTGDGGPPDASAR